MHIEQRSHPRLKPKGLQAGVMFDWANQEVRLEADIVDISYSGIRVKLKHPIASEISGHIKIKLTLPESGTSFSVNGILKHQHADSEYGVQYLDHLEGSIDEVMFECFELGNSTVFIKTP